MGKGLKCADCGREFRGGARTPCSPQLLKFLALEHPNSTFSSGHFVHPQCKNRMWRVWKGESEGQRKVRTGVFYYEPLARLCLNLNHSLLVCSSLPLVSICSAEYSGLAMQETSSWDRDDPGGDAEILGQGGQEDPGEASPSGPQCVRTVESPSRCRGGPFTLAAATGPRGDLRKASKADPAQRGKECRGSHCV